MLKDLECRNAEPRAKPYRISDGASLYLLIRPSGIKSWEFRYKRDGKIQAPVLGTYPSMGLRDARNARDTARAQINSGLSPIAQKKLAAEAERKAIVEAKAKRKQERESRTVERLRVNNSLTNVFEDWYAAYKASWTSKHANQVYQSITDHVLPKLGQRPVGEITPQEVLGCVRKLLDDGKAETASRVKQRLSAVFEYAVFQKMAMFDPVAQLNREFTKLRRVALKLNPKEHIAAVSVNEFPELLRAMETYGGSPLTKALMWLIAYTALRTFEARFAEWQEFDFKARLWVIPAQRMKMKVNHVVPLSDQAIKVLTDLRRLTGDGVLVFPNERKKEKPLSENAVLYALGALGYKDKMTGHGYRTVFSTYAHESGVWRSEVIEAALAHKDKNEIRDAYNRAEYLEERRRLMQWWADEIDRMKGQNG